jgi:hypothetical protein
VPAGLTNPKDFDPLSISFQDLVASILKMFALLWKILFTQEKKKEDTADKTEKT